MTHQHFARLPSPATALVARVVLGACALGLLGAVSAARPAHADALTKVAVNGVLVPVSFNDGDSFRLQAGHFKGLQSRLSGYNTLESFGSVHQWGTWTEHELYVLAKQATLTARRGQWHCEGDGKTDTYGRLLLWCKDLALTLVGEGLAQVYSVDDKPGDPDLVLAQDAAMRANKGIWAHGVPRNIMTSLHSKEEGGDKNGVTSNRLVSTRDGRSSKMLHNDTYKECQKVCAQVPVLADADIEKALELLKDDAGVAAAVSALGKAQLAAAMRVTQEAVARGYPVAAGAWAAPGFAVPAGVSAAQMDALGAAVKGLLDAGTLTATGTADDSCQIYVDFRRRFGGDRAVCLR